MGDLKLLQHSDILFYLVVTVTGYVPIVIIKHSQRSVSKLVPDAETFSICSPPPFNLEKVNVKRRLQQTKLSKEYYVISLSCMDVSKALETRFRHFGVVLF